MAIGVIAWTSAGVSNEELAGGVVKRGAEFRGSHPVVKAHPNLFVPIDTPKSEWPSEFAGLPDPVDHAPTAQVLEPLPADQLKEATVGLRIGFGGGNYWRTRFIRPARPLRPGWSLARPPSEARPPVAPGCG
jgi:hypothetical protein